MRNVGIILVGGVGTRLSRQGPKQMVKTAGKTILEHTVTAPNDSENNDEPVVMITPRSYERVATLLDSRFDTLTRILRDHVTTLDGYGEVDLVIPATDTIVKANRNGIITSTALP